MHIIRNVLFFLYLEKEERDIDVDKNCSRETGNHMKRASLAVATGVLLLASLLTLGCGGCATSSASILRGATEFNFPYQSFTLIQSHLKMTPVDCYDRAAGKSCKDMLNEFGVAEAESRGSGAVVGMTENHSYILTAAHVCDHADTVEIRQGPLVLTVKQEASMTTVDYFGNERAASVLGMDHINDVCILSVSGVWTEAIPIAEDLPALGNRVYNIAAPLGIFSPGMVLMFEGFYAGSDPSGNHLYTIPARPGSSGSPILNGSGEVVGMIHSAAMSLENVAISSSLVSIQAIVGEIPKSDVEIIHQLKKDAAFYFLFR